MVAIGIYEFALIILSITVITVVILELFVFRKKLKGHDRHPSSPSSVYDYSSDCSGSDGGGCSGSD
jgi:hypothetical protein